ncbi:hypothetical protein FCV38_11930 [Clostridium sporogenes]|nr:hypothetical protein [Clostridium sporogenes]
MKNIKVFVLNDNIQNGLNIIEGYIEYKKHSNIYRNYFKLEHDLGVNDYNYSNSDITEEQEEILHEILISRNYCYILDEEHLYNYLDCVVCKNDRCTLNKRVEAGLNNFEIEVWKNSKGFLHLVRKEYVLFNIGKKLLCNVEYAFNKKKKIKEIGYDIIQY